MLIRNLVAVRASNHALLAMSASARSFLLLRPPPGLPPIPQTFVTSSSSSIGPAFLSRALRAAASFPCLPHTISHLPSSLRIKICASVHSLSRRAFSTKLSSRSGSPSKLQSGKILRSTPLLSTSTNERARRASRSTAKVNNLRTESRSVLQKSKQSLQTKNEDELGRTFVTRKIAADSAKKESNKTTHKPVKSKANADPKSSKQDSAEAPKRKGKRVMRLDPKDTTSKRFFEGYPLPGEQLDEEKGSEIRGRAQFRAIIPADKLMHHIHKHLLGRRRPSELQKAGYDLNIAPAPLDNIPYSKKGERQSTQEEVFRHKLRFLASANVATSFPPCDVPEVAFAGRSNVGKSSLINALTRQWGVARTSDKPGLTQSINFFRLGGRLCLVDLPGYGFAYANEEKKEAWEELVREFVTTRNGLKRVYLLVDAKWGLKLRDEELIELMEKAGTKYQIVLTKSDTVTPVDLGRRATQIQELFKGNKSLVLPLIMVSSKTGEGLEFFRGHMAKLAKASLI